MCNYYRDPCLEVNCGKHASCQIEGDEAFCVCQEGWTYNPREISAGCVDIDECDKTFSPTGKCGANAVCSNSPGGFSCVCAQGYTGDPFINCYGEPGFDPEMQLFVLKNFIVLI